MEKKFAELINKESLENVSDTPDFIIGKFLDSSLDALNNAILQRKQWYASDKDSAFSQEFWKESARLMDIYRKENNEERVQGIVDCRILFNKLNPMNEGLSSWTVKKQGIKTNLNF